MSMNADKDTGPEADLGHALGPRRGKHRHRYRRRARLGVVIGAVGLVHVALGLWLGHLAPEAQVEDSIRAFVVDLVRAPPEPPPPPALASAQAGGGAPAAKSVVHVSPPREKTPPPEVTAPPVPATDPPVVVGVADTATAMPGQGQGGEGTGTGQGEGSGAGDGRGSGPRFISGPTQAQLRSLHPREAFRRRQGGQVQMICRVRLDTRLEACRVTRETPQNAGFGTAALAAAQYFRFRPPSREGHPMDGAEISVGVEWP